MLEVSFSTSETLSCPRLHPQPHNLSIWILPSPSKFTVCSLCPFPPHPLQSWAV